jgi:indolepyruvate decarboxylase
MSVATPTAPPPPTETIAPAGETIAQYLLARLHELGVRHIFGIPGDYVIGFNKLIEQSPIEFVVNTSELASGYAADAYARVNGIGCACVTYAVGGLSLANAIGCAYAEKSPVVLISGAPGLRERKPHLYLHHTIGGYDTQAAIFEKLTVAHAVLDDPLTAFREIDRVLAACLRHKRPVYFELPRDRIQQKPLYVHAPQIAPAASDPDALAEAVGEAVEMLFGSRKPVIIAGIDIHRFGLQKQLVALAERNQIPMASLLLSKSVVRENHPLFVGVYEAAMGRPEVTKFVEESDCLLMLGAFLNDVEMGIFTQNLDERNMIFAASDGVRIRYHHYHDITLEDFLGALTKVELPKPARPLPTRPGDIYPPWQAQPNTPMTVKRLFQKVNSIIDENTVVVADPGDALFGAADLTLRRGADFISPSFYTTLGFAVPAAVGIQTSNPHWRPIVLVGDGAFQMTGMELSTAVRRGFNPIVIVLNNEGYGTERFILEGKFNDVLNWKYHKLPEVLGAGRGFEVRTENDLDAAMAAALANTDSFSLLNVRLERTDTSPALRRLAERLAKRV